MKGSATNALRLALLCISMIAGGVSFLIIAGSFLKFGFIGDYRVFWKAGQISTDLIYTRAYFSYPPTALPLFQMFGGLPFWAAYGVWTVTQTVLLFLAMRRIMSPEAALLGMSTAAVLGCLVGGQASLLTAALIVMGLTERRAWVGGILLGMVGVFKPQVALAVPLALIACGDYRRFVWAGAVALTLVAASCVAWGPGIWLEWFSALGHFVEYLDGRNINQEDVGLYGLSLRNGLPPSLYVAGIPFGLAVVWLAFSADIALLDRYIALVVGNILLIPYTLGYDLAGLSVCCVAVLMDRERSLSWWVGAAGVVSVWLSTFGLLILAAVLLRRSRPRYFSLRASA